RKVNGARTHNILLILNRDFLFIILIALLAGIPVALYLIRSWLQNFVYHIRIDWWIPVLTGAGFLIVSLLTVSYQSWIAATRNPVKSLRYE
ncbi:MAG: FtsX-like permease family protein, partial [Bacteroidales bacterium]|nr:FtsX-like permease family protein [Bacteroidales bacterium]